jgi:DNA primase catalytic core
MECADLREVIEEVRRRTDIVAVVSRYVPIDRQNKARCPFHKDAEPSFHVNPEGQYFYCFGCGVGGDVFKFLELQEGKPFMAALADLAGRADISMPQLGTEAVEQVKERRLVEDILSETAAYYHKTLTPEVLEYLKEKRGFSGETINRFQIGFANGGLRGHLTGKCGYEVERCLKAGVLRRDDNGQVLGYFREHVIFPNRRHGRVVHLTGRSLGGSGPKYLHLPGPILYLYNEDAVESAEVILVEGPTDCIAATQAGYAAVGMFGVCGFRPEHAEKFSRSLTVYICFDGDEAGQEGAVKVGGVIGDIARIIQLPKGSDLNDFLRQHPRHELDSLIAKAKSVIGYEISLIPADLDKTRLPQRLDPVLRKLATMDRARAEAYLSYEIKPRFKLKKADIDGYRDLVNCYREPKSHDPSGKGSKSGPKEIHTAVFEGLVDIVEEDGQPAFLIRDDTGLSVKQEVELDGLVCTPPPKEQIPWLLPRAEEVLKLCELQAMLPQQDSDGAIYDDLLTYHKEISELPGDEYYDLIAAWVLHTYLTENSQYTPIICLFAVPERGKSRTGKGMINVAYRGIHVESLRDAYIVRVAHNLNASLFFDVKDIWKKAEKNGSEDILLHRYEKGAKVPRVLYPDRGAHKDIVYYSIFGPTVIGTNEGVHRILETRAVPINMPDTARRFENDITQELALPLKESLVAFRARHLGEVLPDIPKPAAGRLGDILKPLLQVIRLVKPDRESAFQALVEKIEEKRMLEKSDSLEAQILEAIIRLEAEVDRGILPVKVITDTLNDDRPEKYRFSYQRIGKRLAAMGLDKARASDGASAIIWDEQKIGKMREAYGLEKTSETSDRSETQDLGFDVSDVSGDTDVCRNPHEEVPHHEFADPQE